MFFKNRHDAGIKLANALLKYQKTEDTVVIGLPRGGVVTAFEIAASLGLPLDVVCPRKIGAPCNPELAIGAVTETGAGFFNDGLISQLSVSQEYLKAEIAKERKESAHRTSLFRKNRPPLHLENKTVILVDDGLATGATMKAAIQWVKNQKPSHLIVAVPVAPQDSLLEIENLADVVVCLYVPSLFYAVGQFYENFNQTSDEEVIKLLDQASKAE